MEWLRKILRPSAKGLSRFQRDEDLVQVNWNALEATLVRLAKLVLSRFASAHSSHTFSALAFDCTAEEGQVLISLTSRSTDASDLWEVGSWEYHGINLDDEDWASGWEEFEMQMQNRVAFLLDERRGKELPSLGEQFMLAATRALVAVQGSHEVHALKRGPEFGALCIEHNESIESAQARMSSL